MRARTNARVRVYVRIYEASLLVIHKSGFVSCTPIVCHHRRVRGDLVDEILLGYDLFRLPEDGSIYARDTFLPPHGTIRDTFAIQRSHAEILLSVIE